MITPEKRKKFENGWKKYCFNLKYCNRWSFFILISGSSGNKLKSLECESILPMKILELIKSINSNSNREKLLLSTAFTLTFYQEYHIIVENRIGKDSITASITFRIQLVSKILRVDPFDVHAVSFMTRTLTTKICERP